MAVSGEKKTWSNVRVARLYHKSMIIEASLSVSLCQHETS